MTVVDPVATHAGCRPEARAVVDLDSDRSWSYAELDAAVDRLAAWLVSEFGPASGVRVATLAVNRAEILIVHLACTRAGTIFAPFNWRLAPAEIELLAGDAEPALLFHDTEFAPPVAAERAIPIEKVLQLGDAGARPPGDARRPFDAVATLLYTSGTSGRPKGVMLSEENVFFGCSNFIYGNDVTVRSVFLCDMPLFHTAGLHAATRVPIQAGACVLISRGFDVAGTLARLTDSALGVTHYFSVPQMAAWIRAAPEFEPERLRGLVAWAIGGAPNPKANTERFVTAGIRIAEGFGMSEIGSAFGMPTGDLDTLLQKAGSCGRPFMTLAAKVVDDNGDELPAGEVGELCVRGPSVTRGYWNQPETTEQAFRDGWFRTGDAARKDADGFFYIVDRRKDMFISGGENVYPAEVEAAIAELPGIAECAVIGVPDERWGEVGRAYVIPAADRKIDTDDVLNHCRQRLAAFKVPKTAVVTDALPRTASGKLQKHVLKERALREIAGG